MPPKLIRTTISGETIKEKKPKAKPPVKYEHPKWLLHYWVQRDKTLYLQGKSVEAIKERYKDNWQKFLDYKLPFSVQIKLL
jgi:hypothetical protein